MIRDHALVAGAGTAETKARAEGRQNGVGEAQATPLWTEGVYGDGAVILCDGSPVAITEVLARLNAFEASSPPPPDTRGAVGGETFETIRQWCEETFGPVAPDRIATRATEEMDELRADPTRVEEAADVVIVLARHPDLWAAVERKMAVNRARKWRLMGDGTGYHVKDTPTPSDPTVDQGASPSGSGYPAEPEPLRVDRILDDETRNLIELDADRRIDASAHTLPFEFNKYLWTIRALVLGLFDHSDDPHVRDNAVAIKACAADLADAILAITPSPVDQGAVSRRGRS